MTEKQKIRKYLYEDEVQTLLKDVEKTRYPFRNKALILLNYIHGYRASEICDLRWSDVDLDRRVINVRRLKNGIDFKHKLTDEEVDILLKLKEHSKKDFPYVFMTERGEKMSRFALAYMINSINKKSSIKVRVHWHMLRHAKGCDLRRRGVRMEDIRDYMGHKHISSTEIYTRMAENPIFDDINTGSIFS